MGLQTFRDWVLRFNAAGPTGLVDGKPPGQAPRLDQAQRDELARLIEDGPIPAVHGVVRWRLSDLAQWVMERYRTSVSEQTLSRYLRTMGYRKLSARPRHFFNQSSRTPVDCQAISLPPPADISGRAALVPRVGRLPFMPPP